MERWWKRMKMRGCWGEGVVAGGRRSRRRGSVAMQRIFCFLLNSAFLFSSHPLCPMSWVSVTFGTWQETYDECSCQSNRCVAQSQEKQGRRGRGPNDQQHLSSNDNFRSNGIFSEVSNITCCSGSVYRFRELHVTHLPSSSFPFTHAVQFWTGIPSGDKHVNTNVAKPHLRLRVPKSQI